MAEADLGPSELDLLEDALEDLELGGPLDDDAVDVDPRVRARLADYRSVLAVARQALPLEDVPAGVLDGVLAQARQAAAAAPAVVEVREPWWTRLRRSFMVPAIALAGTAALVLWVFDPKEQAKLTDPPAPEAPSAAARSQAAGEADAKRAPEAAVQLEQLDADEGERAEASPATPTVAPTDAPAADAKAAAPAQPRATAGAELENEEPAKPAEGSGGAGSGAVPGGVLGGTPPTEAQNKPGDAGSASGRWDIVTRGDRARQAGDCVAAREEYALALEDDEPRVRARAFAGLGLCDAAAGDEASADANYERARALDDAVEGFIASQNERDRGGGKKSPKPSRKSKVQPVDAFDDVAADPFKQ